MMSPWDNLTISIPDLISSVKGHCDHSKHAALDEMLRRYLDKEVGKQQLQLELRLVAGRASLRAALVSMIPGISGRVALRDLRRAVAGDDVRRIEKAIKKAEEQEDGADELLESLEVARGRLVHLKQIAKKEARMGALGISGIEYPPDLCCPITVGCKCNMCRPRVWPRQSRVCPRASAPRLPAAVGTAGRAG